MEEFVKVSIPKEYVVQDKLNGQCGSCRFKQDIKCLLFDKETLYTEKTGAIKFKQCPFREVKNDNGININ